MDFDDKFALLERTEKVLTDRAMPQNQELAMLRVFYQAWEALHAIQGDKRNPEVRKAHEQAAQALVDAAQPLRVHYGKT